MKFPLSAVCLCAACLVEPLSAQETVGISGSSTVLPILQKAEPSFSSKNSDCVVELSGGGSGSGIKALTDGLSNIAMSSREIKPSETKLAESKNMTPEEVVIASDMIVPIVNPSNPVKNLSLDELKAVYSGEIKNWKELGGEDRPIAVISRDSSSGTYESWADLVMKKTRVTPRSLLQGASGMIMQAVASNPNAIGYVGLGYLSGKIKPLLVDGIEPTAENALSGKWPIARHLSLFTNGHPSVCTRKVIDFLMSPEGQNEVREAGFLPVS